MSEAKDLVRWIEIFRFALDDTPTGVRSSQKGPWRSMGESFASLRMQAAGWVWMADDGQ